MSPQVTIRPGASDEEIIPKTVEWSRKRELGAMRRARITVERDDALNVTLNEKEDDIQLGNIDTLRLVDVETGGETHTLVCYSYEWLANNVAPFAGGTLKEATDDALVTDLVGDVGAWSTGTVNSQTGTTLSFVFNHALRHEALRRIEKNVPGELKWRDTGTVDYVDRLGSNKSGSITLSSSNGNIEEEINITKRGRELDGTHIRVLGAHEGEAQIFANLVPADDGASYDNRVDYSTSRWDSGDTRDWDVWSNKDVTDQATIEEEAASLGDEITERLVEAKVTIPDFVNVDIGDTVQVTKSDADLDRAMRIHRMKTQSKAGTVTHDLLLSTRTIIRSEENEDLRDIQRFNKGFQGSSVVVQGGGSRQPVDANNNAEIPFFYPDIEFENKAELFVRGLNYRHYSTPNQHDHTISTTSTDNSEYSQVVDQDASLGTETINQSWTTVGSITPSSDTSMVIATSGWRFGGSLNNPANGGIIVRMRFKNTTTNTVFPDSGDIGAFGADNTSDNYPGFTFIDPSNCNGETLEVQAKRDFSGDETLSFSTYIQAIGQHTHDVSDTSSTAAGVTPGIQETADTPSNVNVQVGGSTVASNIGSGAFQTTVDISNELSVGSWNLIELTSDDLGHIQAVVSVDGYKQIGKQ